MKKRRILGAAFLAASIILQSGCASFSTKEVSGGNAQTQEQQKPETVNYIKEFNTLIEKDVKIGEVISFLDKNISLASKEDASKMVIKFEEIQKKNLSVLEGKIFNEDIQKKFMKEHGEGSNINQTESIKDPALKELVKEVSDTGFKTETAEGMYFPKINYEYYKKYSAFVTPDIMEYIEIMSIESNNVPAKDAAFVIGWDEILVRALRQEEFIETYKSSAKINDVKELYKNYVLYVLYGINNTPLFSYDTKTMNIKAKDAYLNTVKANGESKLLKTVNEYLSILEKSKYKLTDEVEKFRKNAVDLLTDSVEV
jgi:hypothetical protein